MGQCLNIHRCYNKELFDNMFEVYKDKINIPEQSKNADMYFYIQDNGVYLCLDDMRNPVDIINQKLDDVTRLSSYYRGYEIEFNTHCTSGNTWVLIKTL